MPSPSVSPPRGLEVPHSSRPQSANAAGTRSPTPTSPPTPSALDKWKPRAAGQQPPKSPLVGARYRANSLSARGESAFKALRRSQPSEVEDSLGFTVPKESRPHRESYRRRAATTSNGSAPRSRAESPSWFANGRSSSSSAEGEPLESLAQLKSIADIRKYGWLGVAPGLRRRVWLHSAGGHAMRIASQKSYAELLVDGQAKLSPESLTQIEIDVPRTFSHCHPRFNEESHDCLLEPLGRVLTAVTYYQDSVYWQGYNFMAGILLLVMKEEEEAFWTFAAIIRKLLPRVLGAEGPNTEILLLDELVRQRHPALLKQLAHLGVPLRTWTAPWVICMFSTSLPPETVLRVWDCILLTSASEEAAASLLHTPSPPRLDPSIDGLAAAAAAPAAEGEGSGDMSVLAPAEVAPNVLVLMCLAVIKIVYKEMHKDIRPDKLNSAFKTGPMELYEAEALLSVAVNEVAGGDNEVWSPSWTMHLEIEAVRQRACKMLHLQAVRSSRYEEVQRAFVRSSSVRRKTRLNEEDLVAFFHDMYAERDGTAAADDGRESGAASDAADEGASRRGSVFLPTGGEKEADREAAAAEDGASAVPASSGVEHEPGATTKAEAALGLNGDGGETAGRPGSAVSAAICGVLQTQWMAVLSDDAWAVEARAFFRMINEGSTGHITRKHFVTMARAYPHLTQSLLPGTEERLRFKHDQLRDIFDSFGSAGKHAGLTRDEVVAMVTTIHRRAGEICGEEWASDDPEAKASFTQEDWNSDYARLKRWETEAAQLLEAAGSEVLTFADFLHCTVAHPVISIGICLLRHSDVKPQSMAEAVEPGALALKLRQQELEQHLSQVLISINPSGADTVSNNEALNSGISETFLGRSTSMESTTFFATVVGATYVPSNSMMEALFQRGHIEYTVQLTTEDAMYSTPSCRHEDFVRMVGNLCDEYPKSTRLSEAHVRRIRQFKLPDEPLKKYAEADVLERKNLWKTFLDIAQSEESARVRVCLRDLVKHA